MITQRTLSAVDTALDWSALFAGLNATPRQLPFYLFYDERGSDLFRQITMTPEYYLTRTEKQLLRQHASAISDACGHDRVWFEPGAGCCDKALLLLQAHAARAYAAMDISASALASAVEQLQSQLPSLPVYLFTGDFARDLPALQQHLPPGPRTVFYPGSSIGNFAPNDAVRWLQQLRMIAGDDGQLLIGFDLPKHPSLLHAAYNDADGVTEAFHLNVLQHLRRCGVEVNDNDFAHHAFYNEVAQRIEMHLRVLRDTRLRYQQYDCVLKQGEHIVTEYSYKYDLAWMLTLLLQAGWRYRQHWCDSKQWFAQMLCDAAPQSR